MVKTFLHGVGVSKGIRMGKAYFYSENIIKVENEFIAENLIASELERLSMFKRLAYQELETIIEQTKEKYGEENSKIIEVQLELLNDPVVNSELESKIKSNNYTAAKAIIEVFNNYTQEFIKIGDNYFGERAQDIKDLGDRLLRIAAKDEKKSLNDHNSNNQDRILIIDEITPSKVVQLHQQNITGFIARTGGRNSHSAILARSLNIPAIVGLGDEIKHIKPDDVVIIDGDKGEIYLNPTEETKQKYQNLSKQELKASEELIRFKDRKSITRDGHQLKIAANISTSHEAKLAFENGAAGIGLFRTEFIFINNDHLPNEDEQFKVYKDIAKSSANKTIIIRTIDIGGDKRIPYLPIEKEDNPFLGFRAIRLSLEYRELFLAQLRAILRASVYGKFKIMFPMIATLQEIRQAKDLLYKAMGQLKENNIPYDEAIEIGMMIEVPSAAFLADRFAEEVDFFSIGTNDLTQYTLAVDRTNDKVSHLYDCFNPAVIHLIKRTIDAAHSAHIWVSMCGGMASNPLALPLLIGLDLDEFSVDISAINEIKKAALTLSYSSCKETAEKVLSCSTNEEVRRELKKVQKLI